MSAETCCEKFGNAIGCNCCITNSDFHERPIAEVVQNNKRQCTDIPCLLILLFVFASEIFLIAYSDGQGAKPELLYRGVDYQGKVCNSDNNDGQYAAWANLEKSYNVKVCVDKCTKTNKDNYDSALIGLPYASKSYLSAWCLPKHPGNFSAYEFSDAGKTYDRAVGDVNTAKYLILIMAFVSIIISFAYLKIVACVGRFIIWFTMIVVLVGGVALVWLLLDRGIDDYNSKNSKTSGEIEIAIAVILGVLMLLILLALIFMRKSITLAIDMLNEASHAIADIRTVILFPVVYSMIALGFFAFWVVVAVYIYSVKEKSTKDMPSELSYLNVDTYVKYTFDNSMQNALIYHFIVLYYIVQVIIYFGFMVIAGTMADWYFSDWDLSHTKKLRGEGKAELSNSPLCESFCRVLRFHLGTLSFGALVITIIRVIRCIVVYLESKSKAASNPCVKCVFCCVNCCLRCCQCIFDRISKEGFIFTTIYGSAFCFSSFQALRLLLSNIARSAMVASVSRLTEVFGRFAIAALNTGIACLVLFYLPYYERKLSSIWFPALIVFIISYTIAALFMQVLEVTVDTIFLCFLVDETVHKTPKFASVRLSKMVSLNANSLGGDPGANGSGTGSGSARQKMDSV